VRLRRSGERSDRPLLIVTFTLRGDAQCRFHRIDDAIRVTCANDYGGTRFAAPMWATFIALVNQQLVANGSSRVGSFNATVYPQNESGGALTSTYTSDFHDITSGKSGGYSAVTGYGLVTGWGSPKAALITTLSQ
jgi:subtilase family serine protease